jgi:hypothetical protein
MAETKSISVEVSADVAKVRLEWTSLGISNDVQLEARVGGGTIGGMQHYLPADGGICILQFYVYRDGIPSSVPLILKVTAPIARTCSPDSADLQPDCADLQTPIARTCSPCPFIYY